MSKKDLVPFVKGDPRINRKGRPKSFDAWRALLQDLANEPAVVSDQATKAKRLVLIKIPKTLDGKPVFEDDGVTPVMIDHYATNAEMVARQWMQDPKRQQGFVDGAYGKVPQAVTVGNPDGSALAMIVKTLDYKIFDTDELTRILAGESEILVYADALKRIAASQSQSSG